MRKPRFDSLGLKRLTRIALLFSLQFAAVRPALAITGTATTLAITNSGTPAISVSAPVAVKLTAQVKASGSPVSQGAVNYCDLAVNSRCSGSALLGTAQLTTAGTATLVSRFGFGSHSIQAIFIGTTNFASSKSAAMPLTQKWRPGASLSHIASAVGSPATTYDLTVTITGLAAGSVPPAPSGTVSFLDTSNGNSEVASGTLSTSSGPAIGFKNIFQPLTGRAPSTVAVGDFNGDGYPDFAVANSGDDTISVFLGTGDGSYSLAHTLTLTPIGSSSGTRFYYILAGDFNGDGDLDLAVSDSTSTFSVLLGNGDGSFQAPIATSASFALWGVGDFNNDGILDLAATGADNGSVRIELGNGDGTFSDHVVYAPTSPIVTTAAIGDMNNDGYPDLIVTTETNPNTLLLMQGNGDGTFKAPQSISLGTYSAFLGPAAIADLNEDGILDIIVPVLQTAGTGNGGALVLLGNGNGTFQPQNVYGSAKTPSAVAVGDLNGDGFTDIALVNYAYGGSVSVLLGRGDGTFPSQRDFPVGTYPAFGKIVDLNGDGKADLVILNRGVQSSAQTAQRLSVLLNLWGSESAVTVDNVTIPGTGTHNIEAYFPGDVNYRQATSATIPLAASGP